MTYDYEDNNIVFTIAKCIKNIDKYGIISIDSDGVYLRDARIYGIPYQEKTIKFNKVKLYSKKKPSITKKFWFFIDGIEFYSINDIEIEYDNNITQTKGV